MFNKSNKIHIKRIINNDNSHTKHSDNPSANPLGSSGDNHNFVVVAEGHVGRDDDDDDDDENRPQSCAAVKLRFLKKTPRIIYVLSLP